MQTDRRSFGLARCLQCWNGACLFACVPDLFDASVGDSLDQRYLACAPPPEFLLDDPMYLSVIHLDHKSPNARSEIISGNERG